MTRQAKEEVKGLLKQVRNHCEAYSTGSAVYSCEASCKLNTIQPRHGCKKWPEISTDWACKFFQQRHSTVTLALPATCVTD